MPAFSSRFRRLRIVETALWIMLPGFFVPLFAADPVATETIGAATLSTAKDDVYTINFNNISIIEYIRFVAKISGSNFVFDENDLKFNVTIVSEDKAPLQDIFSALVQVLRINNLSLLEHEGNYIISRDAAVTQLPSVVTGDKINSHTPLAPIITRVFRIKNTTVNSIAAIIRPMVSAKAMVSVSTETNQLIISDIATNIDEIANLIATLDAPHSPLDIESYVAKNIAPKDLATLVQPLLAPFSEGNPLIFVPQIETNTLFIVSTPHLIERARAILEDLDIPSSEELISLTQRGNIFLYQIQNLPEDILVARLHEVAANLKKAAHPPAAIIKMLTNAHYIKDSNSVLFVGDEDTYAKVTELLKNLDMQEGAVSFFIYPIKNNDRKALETALAQFVQQLKANRVPDHNLIAAAESMKYMNETHSFIFTGKQSSLTRLQEVLPVLDTQIAETQGLSATRGGIFIYQLKYVDQKQFEGSLKQLILRLKNTNTPDNPLIAALESAYYIRESNSIVFTGTDAALARTSEFLSMLDTANAATQQSKFYLYAPQRAIIPVFENAIHQFTETLKTAPSPDTALIAALQSVRYLKEINSFTFIGTADAIARIQQILPVLDVVPQSAQSYVYKIQNTSEQSLGLSLDQFIKNLEGSPNPDAALINAIRTRRFIKETNSYIFTGDQAALDRLAKLMPDFDVTGLARASDHFYLYTPQYRKGDALLKAVQEMAANFKASGLTDAALLHTLETAKWVPSSGAIYFTGDNASIESIKQLMTTVDVPLSTQPEQIFLYRPQYLSREQLEQSLRNLVGNLDETNPSDVQLKETISTVQWVPSAQSLAFKGMAPTIDRVKQLLASLDVPASESSSVYFLYKLAYADPQTTLTYLESVARNLSKDSAHMRVQAIIKTIKIIKDNNALLLTGPKEAVEEVKTMIAQYDTPEHAAQGPAGNFFIYKPQNLPAQEVMKSLQSLVADLAASSNIDPALQKAVKGIRYVEATQSLVVSGSDATIAQVKTLLEEVDVTAKKGIYQIGAKTFFIYKMQFASTSQLMQALTSVAADLTKGGVDDQALAAAIHSMTPITETNSILFTGTPDALQRIQELIAKFDIPSMAGEKPPEEVPLGFVIYRPQHKPGDELIEMACDFIQNLKMTGVVNHRLFDSVNNLRWIKNTCSLLITGDSDTIKQVQDLLHQFDVAAPHVAHVSTTTGTIGETGFLIYKLQYHRGDDIQKALRRVAADLSDAHRGEKIPIAEAIEALQWIPVTNSLLTSGAPDVLSRIRELVQNLDVPLRQVFIEVLVVQTSLDNLQQFGLNWAGRMQYKNQAGAQMSNLGPIVSTPNLQTTPLWNQLNTVTPPNANNFSTPTGLDLGVIGDLIFHKGKSYLSLGSLVQALETDTDSTIVLNPKIIAQDSNTATLFVGFNVPFQGSFVTSTAANVATSSSLEYRNVGHNLALTPTIGSGDLITLDITEDISQVLNPGGAQGVANSTSLAVAGITTSQTTMSTRVHVPDGHFVALTGQIAESKTHSRTQIPCLGGLPLIGAAFTYTQRENNRTNLIIFIRPQIIKTFDEYKEVTEHQEDLYKVRASLPVLKETFDEYLDIVKMPNNE